MKFTFAVCAILAATTQATKLNKEVYMRSIDLSDSSVYSSPEQWDHDKEIAEAQQQAQINELKR